MKKIITIGLSSLLLSIIIITSVLVYVHVSTEPLIFSNTETDSVLEKPVGIVFGASVNPLTNMPSDVLADRIQTAVDLYEEGKIQKIMMSGDNRESHYNEPVVMQKYAMSLGVPPDDIVLDYAGRRTYDTCYRAKNIFQIDEAILITQTYHLYRALFTCNALGLKSFGVSANRQPYIYQTNYNIREIPATLLSVLEVTILHPKPILGDKEEVFTPDLPAS